MIFLCDVKNVALLHFLAGFSFCRKYQKIIKGGGQPFSSFSSCSTSGH
jgi:hypothetical protein